MDAAEQPEQQPQDEGQRDGQQRAEQPVEEELDQLKGGVAADPHPVEAVRRDGLGDDVLEADLRREEEKQALRIRKKFRKRDSVLVAAATSRYSPSLGADNSSWLLTASTRHTFTLPVQSSHSGCYLQVRVDVVRVPVGHRVRRLPLPGQDGLHGPAELVLVHDDAALQLLLLHTHVRGARCRSDGARRAAGAAAAPAAAAAAPPQCAVRRSARHPAPYGKQRNVWPRRTHNKPVGISAAAR